MNIDIKELGVAYRRVKADLYYTKHANSIKLLRFEKHLASSLRELHEMIVGERVAELCSAFCHGWRLVPKAVKLEDEDQNNSKTTILVGDELRRVSRCDLRIIEDLPVEFHIVTQLWIDRLGGRLEKLMSNRSFGNRIRCHGDEVNVLYPGTFKFWMRQYRDWHNNGLSTIKTQLGAGKNIAVLTTDFTAFYHNLSADFIDSADFWNAIGLSKFSEDERRLTKIIARMLKTWAVSTPLGTGLPVGASISSVLANLALTLLDRKLEFLKGLVYYGRYVDDIILAIENPGEITCQEDFVKWLCTEVKDFRQDGDAVVYGPCWLKLDKGCSLAFQKEKTKVFLFNGRDGKDFIVGLENQIHKRTSEWRALPELPDDPEDLIKCIIAITDSHGVEVDKLRQAEEASIRRAAFAMKLSDFGEFALCLDASDWSMQRNAFIKAVSIYFTTAKNYFELNRYFPRLLGLALYGMSASDAESFTVVEEMLSRVARSLNKAFEGTVAVSSRDATDIDVGFDAKQVLIYQVVREFTEAVAASVRDCAVREKALTAIGKAFPMASGTLEELPSYDEMLLADLAQQPYKTVLFSALDVRQVDCDYNAHPMESLPEIIPKDLYYNAVNFLKLRREWNRDILARRVFSGFVFPTRKMSRVELLSIVPAPYSRQGGDRQVVSEYLRLISYASVEDANLTILRQSNSKLLKVVDADTKAFLPEAEKSKRHERINIALAYWRMSEDDWLYQINGRRNPCNPDRFSRLMKLTNDMLKSASGKGGKKLDYIIYPELAMPWRWFLLVAKKVRQYGVSLISGVEYIRSSRKGMLRNEVWCGLTYKGGGFPDALLMKIQKTCPAQLECEELRKYKWIFERLPSPGGLRAGDVIMHDHDKGELFFSVLICSDLTDINLRARLRGRIDLLCVPAWNKDVKTFNALIMASALDLHAYVALCNNGEYGDTRLRGPMAEEHERDVVQLKGGDNDYWVVGSVDVNAIRRFQAGSPASVDPNYKPLPVGFEISKERLGCVEAL